MATKSSIKFTQLQCVKCGSIMEITRSNSKRKEKMHVKTVFCKDCGCLTEFCEVSDSKLKEGVLELDMFSLPSKVINLSVNRELYNYFSQLSKELIISGYITNSSHSLIDILLLNVVSGKIPLDLSILQIEPNFDKKTKRLDLQEYRVSVTSEVYREVLDFINETRLMVSVAALCVYVMECSFNKEIKFKF